ncbi:hypothetical protein DFP72DRAFT_845361 [Ephemerocybe angulata]|uniref:Uncharacterized protein n=1 Tax=Ephemerocybe angulata TaxID=980116 RepID=A0A8H6I2T3_9AGAR|nr:hypothetical protein DFP72DRAFT_845361 [Tulosesus angulatus]
MCDMSYPIPDFGLSLDWSTSNPWATHIQDNEDSNASHSSNPSASRTLNHSRDASVLRTIRADHAPRSRISRDSSHAQIFSIERNAGESLIIVIPSPPTHSTYHVQVNRAGSANFGPNYGQIHQDGIEDLHRDGRMPVDKKTCSEAVSEDNGRRGKGLWGMIVGLFQ